MDVKLLHLVYSDTVIAVGVASSTDCEGALSLVIRWLEPRPITSKDGRLVEITNAMGGETAWFVVPYTFAAAIARTLIEQKAAGLQGFDEVGFEALLNWLVEIGELHDSMGY